MLSKLFRAIRRPSIALQRIESACAARLLSQAPGSKPVDIVDFGDVFCLMYKGDNLYDRFVRSDRKGVSPEAVSRMIASGEIERRVPTVDEVETSRNPRFAIQAVMAHAWRRHLKVAVLDVGAHTGLVGLRLARFALRAGHPVQVDLFEPGSMSDLARWNVTLNGLDGLVAANNTAVSTYRGLGVFSLPIGATDSDSLNAGDIHCSSRIVQVVPLEELLESRGTGCVTILKLDTEGLEAALLDSISAFRKVHPVIPIFEFTPGRMPGSGARDMLLALQEDFALFDLGYAPQPVSVSAIPAPEIETFISGVKERRFGYTDILGISRILPEFETLCGRLSRFDSGSQTPDGTWIHPG